MLPVVCAATWYFNLDKLVDNHDACTKLATSSMHFNPKCFVCSLTCTFKYSGKLAKIAYKKSVIDTQSIHQPKDDESSFTLKNASFDKTLNKFAFMNILLDKKILND